MSTLRERVERIVNSPKAEEYRDEATRHVVAQPYADNRYVRLLDEIRTALATPESAESGEACGATEDGYRTCTLPLGHPGRFHQEWRDGKLWAESSGDDRPARSAESGDNDLEGADEASAKLSSAKWVLSNQQPSARSAESAPQDGTRADEVEVLASNETAAIITPNTVEAGTHCSFCRATYAQCTEDVLRDVHDPKANDGCCADCEDSSGHETRYLPLVAALVARTVAEAGLASPAQVEAARHEAWAEGYEVGMDDERFYLRGSSFDSDASEYPHANPYKGAES